MRWIFPHWPTPPLLLSRLSSSGLFLCFIGRLSKNRSPILRGLEPEDVGPPKNNGVWISCERAPLTKALTAGTQKQRTCSRNLGGGSLARLEIFSGAVQDLLNVFQLLACR